LQADRSAHTRLEFYKNRGFVSEQTLDNVLVRENQKFTTAELSCLSQQLTENILAYRFD